MREHRDRLFGARRARLGGGRRLDRLHELRPLGDDGDPVHCGGEERFVEIRVEVRGQRREHDDAVAAPADVERKAEVRLHAEPFLHAAQLGRIVLQVARTERQPGGEHPHDAAAVGERHHVETQHLLLVR